MEKPKTGAICGKDWAKPWFLSKVIKAGNFAVPEVFAHWFSQGSCHSNRQTLKAGFSLNQCRDAKNFYAKNLKQIVWLFACWRKNHFEPDFAAETNLKAGGITRVGGKSGDFDCTSEACRVRASAQQKTEQVSASFAKLMRAMPWQVTADFDCTSKFYKKSKPYWSSEACRVRASAQQKTKQVSASFAKLMRAVRWQETFSPLVGTSAAMRPYRGIKPQFLFVVFFTFGVKVTATLSYLRQLCETGGTFSARFNGKQQGLALLRFDIIGFKLGKEFFRLFNGNHAFGKKGQNVFAFKIVIFRCGNDGKQAKRHFFLCNGSTHSKGSHRIDWRHGLSFFIKTILPSLVKLPAVLIKKAGYRLVFNKKIFANTISFQKQSCALLFFVCWLFLSSGFLKRHFAPDGKEKHAALNGFCFLLLLRLHLWKEYLQTNDGQQKFTFTKLLTGSVVRFSNNLKIFALFNQSLMQNFLERWRAALTPLPPLPLGKKRGA